MEHNLLCSYLYAVFSLRRGKDEGLSQAEDAAVGRWRRAILGVAVQEMGHLATVNNLIVAVGGTPHFDRPNFPIAAGYHPPSFTLRLTPFDEPTLEHFIFLERPEAVKLEDPEDFEHAAGGGRGSPRRWITPSAHDYETIGQLYESIRKAIRKLAAARGHRAFVSPERQVGTEEVGIPGIVPIKDLATALAALRLVVEQGEGASASAHDSHFARFSRIKEEWSVLKARNSAFHPAHPAASNPVMRKPVDSEDRTWITSPECVPKLDLANAIYGVVLLLLAQLYEPIAREERRCIADSAITLMHGLSRLGEDLARMPAAAGVPGVHAGLTFTVPRNTGARADSSLIAERLDELALAYEGIFGSARNAVREAHAALG